jgi:hypothetical protein
MGNMYKGVCLAPNGDANILDGKTAVDSMLGKIPNATLQNAPPCTPDQNKAAIASVSRNQFTPN